MPTNWHLTIFNHTEVKFGLILNKGGTKQLPKNGGNPVWYHTNSLTTWYDALNIAFT